VSGLDRLHIEKPASQASVSCQTALNVISANIIKKTKEAIASAFAPTFAVAVA
jgi:hypothetical protein